MQLAKHKGKKKHPTASSPRLHTALLTVFKDKAGGGNGQLYVLLIGLKLECVKQ